VKQFFIVGCCIGHMPSLSLYPNTVRYLRHLIACVGAILVVCAGGCANVACVCCDGNTLSALVGILNGSATSILGLRCFGGLVVDVLATNFDVVVTCAVTGAGLAVTVPIGVVDVAVLTSAFVVSTPTVWSCACGNCDVLTATGCCGVLVPLHQAGVGLILCDDDDIVVGGGGPVDGCTGVAGMFGGVTGVIAGIIGTTMILVLVV